MKQLLRASGEKMGLALGLGPALRAAHRRDFNRLTGNRRSFHGVYPDFQAALRTIPPNRVNTYDHQESADRLLEEGDAVTPSDYPLMFWFSQHLNEISTVFDWGGYVGRTFFVFARYMALPSGLTWIVSDVPAVVALGEKFRKPACGSRLFFTSDFKGLEAADVLIASGSLQFIESPWRPLADLQRRPRHVLVDKVPAYDMPSAMTLQNMGPAILPNHLFNRTEFVERFRLLGYRLVDSWSNPGLDCRIPFEPRHSIRTYSGFYFRSE